MNPSSPPVQGGLSAETCAARAQGPAPSLLRRLAAFTYEGIIQFAVIGIPGAVYTVATHQTNESQGRSGIQSVLFLISALYFLWFWTHGGQTLPMRSWQLRLVSKQGGPVTLKPALVRFMFAWLWFIPPFLAMWLLNWPSRWSIYSSVFFGWLALYALLSKLLPQQQFLHDVISGTRLIDNRTEVQPQ